MTGLERLVGVEREFERIRKPRPERQSGENRPGYLADGSRRPPRRLAVGAMLLAPAEQLLTDRVEERDDEMLLLLVPPGAEAHGDDAGRVELVLDGAHQRRLAGAPATEDADRELRVALDDDLGERVCRVREAKLRLP